MKRIVHWMARMVEDIGGIDDRFSSFEDRHVFDSGWVGGKVIVSAEEAAALRHSLYLINVLSWATIVPILTMTVIFVLSLNWGPPSASPSYFGNAFVAVLLMLTFVLGLIPNVYTAMAVRGKPRFGAHAERARDDATTVRRRRRNTTPTP